MDKDRHGSLDEKVPTGLPAGRSFVCVAVFFAMAVLLNAPAMLKSADNLPFENAVRRPAMALLSPIAGVSSALKLNAIRSFAESISRTHLE